MKPMIRRLSRFGLLAGAFALAACASNTQNSTSILTEAALAAKTAFNARTRSGAALPAGAVPDGLTRAAIAGETRPMMLIHVEKLGSAGTLLKTGENRGYQTWVSPDQLTLTTKGGVATATRGLPRDLLAGDAEPTLAALRAGGASRYSKVLRHIGPDRQIQLQNLTCQMRLVGSESIVILERSHSTRRFAETCEDATGASQRNDFWAGSDGFIWRSRQYLDAELGYIETRQLIR